MTSTSTTEEPLPWYRPVLKVAKQVEEVFEDPNYVILGGGMGLLFLALLIMICCCRCANQRRRKRHLEKRIEEEQNKDVTHDLIIKPNSSLYQRQSVKQDNIFRQDQHGPDPQITLNTTLDNEDTLLKNGLIFQGKLALNNNESNKLSDILPATKETDKNVSTNDDLNTTVANTTINDSERSKNSSVKEVSEMESPRQKAPSHNSSMISNPQPFRLPPIDMVNSSFKMGQVGIPIVPPVVAKVSPVKIHVPTPPTSPMPADSPSISQASSNESLFDNISKKHSPPMAPKVTIPQGVAYSSIARKLFPLNSEFMSFLAKEGLHQDWQIYTLNNRAIEAFLYKYIIFISGNLLDILSNLPGCSLLQQ